VSVDKVERAINYYQITHHSLSLRNILFINLAS
jgi:hypothetical protein